MTIQLARFEKPLGGLAELASPERLAPESIDATLDEMVKRDSRGRLFALEGLLRIYGRVHGGRFADLRATIKAQEDALGAYTEKLEYLEFAQKAGGDADVLATLSRIADAERASAKTRLREMPGALDEVRAALADARWYPEEDDARAVVEQMANELRRIEGREYDAHDLQGGIHELRRNLRWFLIYIQALDGLVLLEPSRQPLRLNAYSYLESHPIAQSRFSKVEKNPRLRFSTRIPFAYFLAVSKLVNELGAVKSIGESVEATADAIVETRGASEEHARAEAEQLASSQPGYVANVPRAARKIMKELDETGLLKQLRKSLRRGLGPAG